MNKSAFAGVMLVVCGSLLATSPAVASRFSLVPVSASGVHEIIGNEIRLTGTGQVVKLELRLSEWGPAELKFWQATFDPTGFDNGIGTPLTVRLLPCTGSGECFMNVETGSLCNFPPPVGGNCSPAYINRTHPNWVHANEDNFIVTADVTTAIPEFIYFAVLDPPITTPDPGVPKYGGSLWLSVPTGAIGTYTVSMNGDSSVSFMGGPDNNLILPVNVDPAIITIRCDTATDCNDNNACTTDTCSAGGVCNNTPNFDDTNFCCNPLDGTLTQLSDSNDCTDDVCNADGSVTHPNLAAMTACGDPTNTECDNPDSCDGNGTCLSRFEPTTTACGSPTNTECDPADLCDGAGSCVINVAAEGAPCGDPTSTVCDSPDTCNGFGACLTNQTPDGTPCDDMLFCTENERCTGGVCANGTPRDCADLLTCTTDTCDDTLDKCVATLDPNRCLIGGVCYLDGALNPANTCEECRSVDASTAWSVRPDGSLCNDGNACTGTGRPGIGDDTCTTGVCSGAPDPECNDQCDLAVDTVLGQNFSDNSTTGPDDAEASCQPVSNGDVWFAYTAPCDGAVFVSTTGSALLPSNDSVLSVYDGCPNLGGVEIACDDDSGVGLSAALTFTTVAGVRYLIRVAGFETNVGPIVLNVLPVNDCQIDGVCYAKGDLNPDNGCLACIPELTSTQWSPRLEGSPCGSNFNDECDSPDACDGAGLCEVNFKPDGTPCPDEVGGNVCTKDLCSSGLCTHPPEPPGLLCGDPSDTDCDDPDTCDGGGSCVPNFADAGFPCGDPTEKMCDNPDICDGNGGCLENLKPNGTPCDDADVCTGTDVCTLGTCAGTSILEPPLLNPLSARQMIVTPQPPGSPAPVAFFVTSPNDWPCLGDYITVDHRLGDVSQRVFMLNDDWGEFVLSDPDLFPSSTYYVVSECGAFQSAPAIATMRQWGDVNNDGETNVLDLSIVVDMVKGIDTGFRLESGDLNPCEPDGILNVLDVTMSADAVSGLPYPCSQPCHP